RDHIDRAPSDAQVAVQHYVNANNERACRLMARQDYAHVRDIHVMRIALDQAPPAPEPLAGIQLRTFIPGQDEYATWEAVEEAFADSWGRPRGDYERWLTFTEDERQDPALWLLAEDEASGQIAGVTLARMVPGAGGWVGAVGVRRTWRGRGLGLALLRA